MSEINRVQMIQDNLDVRVTFDHEYRGEGEERKSYILEDKIKGFNPRFTPQQWVAIAQREGSAYVGGCCGNMSLLQDYVEMAFRDSGYIDGHQFLQMASLARSHDGFEEFDDLDDDAFVKKIETIQTAKEKIELEDIQGIVDPWAILGVIYNAVVPYLTPTSVEVPKGAGYLGREHHLVSTVADTLTRMDWADLLGERESSEHKAIQLLLKARLLPPMRELLVALEQTGVDFKGWAIINPENDEVLKNQRGECIYPTREEAEAVVEQWARWAEEERERKAKRKQRAAERDEDSEEDEDIPFWDALKSEIVTVAITVEDGLQLRV